MLELNKIRKHPGAATAPKRLGRGHGSGLGPHAGKGHKGQLARSGGSITPGFEGGQTPLYRRIPKRGFTNPTRKEFALVNVSDFDRWDLGSEVISLAVLREKGFVKTSLDKLCVLGNGELKKAVKIQAHKASGSAKEKIEKAGGSLEIVTFGKYIRAKKK
jgi:large subunit ribosomal protein L15